MKNGVYEFACDELHELDEKARKGELTMKDVEYADTLEHYRKSKLTADAMEESHWSGRGNSYDDRGMINNSYDGRSYNGEAYARGYYGPRDSMGRFRESSRDSGLSHELRRIMPMAEDEQTRMELKRLADRVDRS